MKSIKQSDISLRASTAVTSISNKMITFTK